MRLRWLWGLGQQPRPIATPASPPVQWLTAQREPGYSVYDQGGPIILHPNGETTVQYLAWLAEHHPSQWKTLQQALEKTGRAMGLFQGIRIQGLGDTSSPYNPFRVLVRHHGRTCTLDQAGTGVAQVLAVLVAIHQPDPPALLLIEHPEQHLDQHGQRLLGYTLAQALGTTRQCIVETTSEALLYGVQEAVEQKTADPDRIGLVRLQRTNHLRRRNQDIQVQGFACQADSSFMPLLDETDS